jgi:NitT/TauT family transport system permease protein
VELPTKPDASRPPGRWRWRERLSAIWPPALVVAAGIAAWSVAAGATSLGSLSFPGPWRVARSTWQDHANLAPAVWTSTKEALLGISLAIVCAAILAISIDWSHRVRRGMYPLMVASQTIPFIALAPLVIIWFGFGIGPKIALVALFTFFAIAVGLVEGLASADPDAMNLLRTMGATRRQLLVRVRLPSALPQFFTGLKVAVTYAYVAAVIAEYVGAQGGLGFYMQTNKNAFRIDLVFGAVIVTALLTLLLFAVVAALGRGVLRWRAPAHGSARW